MRPVTKIIVHCSATRPDMDIGVDTIRNWHVNQNGWRDIGYHYVIKRNGAIEEGRDLNVIGAHTKGYNAASIGICLIGGINERGAPDANFTFNQYAALRTLIRQLREEFPDTKLYGHRDFSDKACPCFDVKELFN